MALLVPAGASDALDGIVVEGITSSDCAGIRVGTDLMCSAEMEPTDGQSLVRSAMCQMHLSVRGHHSVLKVSRTIADLEDVDVIQTHRPAGPEQHRTRCWICRG